MFYVYVLDRRYPSGWNITGQMKVDYVYCYVEATTTIPGVIGLIKAALRDAGRGLRSVDCIRLAAHGNTGYLQLGTGLTAANANEFAALATSMVLDRYSDGIEIHGCGVGSTTNILGPGSTITNPVCAPGTAPSGFAGNGYTMLRALAKAIGRNVTAGIDCQYADGDWRFEGPIVTVNPNGSYGVIR